MQNFKCLAYTVSKNGLADRQESKINKISPDK